MGAVQQSYTINPGKGFPGAIAEPSAPHSLDSGTIYVPSSATRNPRPGDAIYYDATNDGWAIPTTAAQSLLVTAILSYRQDEVANASDIVEYENGDEIQFVVFGTVWGVAGTAIEPYGQVEWDRADFKWNANARETTLANLLPVPMYYAGRSAAADGDTIKIRVGYGRAI